MKLDPRNPKMVWKKTTCLKEVAPGSYEVTLEVKRYRRNRKALTKTQERSRVEPN